MYNRISDAIPAVALSLPQFYTMSFQNLQEKKTLSKIKVYPIYRISSKNMNKFMKNPGIYKPNHVYRSAEFTHIAESLILNLKLVSVVKTSWIALHVYISSILRALMISLFHFSSFEDVEYAIKKVKNNHSCSTEKNSEIETHKTTLRFELYINYKPLSIFQTTQT